MARDASIQVIFPAAGLVLGPVLGYALGRFRFADEFAMITLITAGGLVGSVLGMAVALVLAVGFRKSDVTSIRGLAGLVLVAALIGWFTLTLLADFVTHGVF